MSRRALGANTLLSFRQINQSSLNFDGLCVCKKRKGYLQKSLFSAVNKIPSEIKKGLKGVQDSYRNRLIFFNYNLHMYDELHVSDVLIVLLHM